MQDHRSGGRWTQVKVSKYGLKSRFVELSKQIILWGEVPSFEHQGIPQLCVEGPPGKRRGLRPSAGSELRSSSGQI